MDSDQMSVASDFSIIPESMVNMEEVETPAPMNASFFNVEPTVSSLSGTSKFHSKVKFSPIICLGTEDEWPLTVLFTYDDDFSPNASDRIALYKTMFSSSKDFLCYKWVPTPSEECDDSNEFYPPVPHTVVFEAKDLPEEKDEYYQMCYLMHTGHIAGVSTAFQLKQMTLNGGSELENAARQVLSIRIRELTKEKAEILEELGNLKESIETQINLKSSNVELMKKNEEYALDAEKKDKLIKDLEDASSAKDATIKQKNEEYALDAEKKDKLIKDLEDASSAKDATIKQLKVDNEELKQELDAMTSKLEESMKNTKTLVSKFKARFESNDNKNQVFEERLEVLTCDNQELKETLKLVKDELEITMKEKVAAEKIASDLSEKLQRPCSDCESLLVTNTKLAKKVKKLKKIIDSLDVASNHDWTCVNNEEKRVGEGEEEEEDEDAVNCEDGDVNKPQLTYGGDSTSIVGSLLTSSVCPSSECSHKLSETVSNVKKRMDDIVHQLTEQTEEMKSLRKEIDTRNQITAKSPSIVSARSCSVESREEEVPPKVPDDRERAAEGVLYGNSFLPAQCTAPVFFPSSGGVSESLLTAPKPSRSAAPSAPSPVMSEENSSSSLLPPPLLPTATRNACRAAVLRQFSDGSNAVTADSAGVATPPTHVPLSQHPQRQENGGSRRHPESDDDDYHSIGEEDSPTVVRRNSTSSLMCPFCPLEFKPTALRLMEEHVDHHIDRTCPVCSQVFQRNVPQNKFENHVHSHFGEEEESEEDSPQDPSGPWDPRDAGMSSFHLLEID